MKTQPSPIDPVCRMTLNSTSNRIAANMDGETYFFCAQACKDRFLANPEKYIGNSKSKRKGFWRRYLDRLNKSTGGKPPACCR